MPCSVGVSERLWGWLGDIGGDVADPGEATKAIGTGKPSDPPRRSFRGNRVRKSAVGKRLTLPPRPRHHPQTNSMKKLSLGTLLLIATQSVGYSQEPRTNQIPVAIQSILSTFLQVTNTPGPTFNIFIATDDTSHSYTRNRASIFLGNTIGGTGIDLTAIPVWDNWDSPPPTGSNPYGGARFNGILVTPDILLQAHHPWAGSFTPQTIYFVDTNNQTVARTVSGHDYVAGTDIEVVRLTKEVPSTITPAVVFAIGALPHNMGIPVLWTDQYRDLYIGVAVLADNSSIVVHQASTTTPFNAYWGTVHGGVVSGDSGAPYMTVINGRLVAMGTWISGGSTKGGGSSFESQVSAINTVIRSLGSTTTLQTIDASGSPKAIQSQPPDPMFR